MKILFTKSEIIISSHIRFVFMINLPAFGPSHFLVSINNVWIEGQILFQTSVIFEKKCLSKSDLSDTKIEVTNRHI